MSRAQDWNDPGVEFGVVLEAWRFVDEQLIGYPHRRHGFVWIWRWCRANKSYNGGG